MKASKEDLSVLRKIFLQLDKSKDGFLSLEEIKEGMKSIQHSFQSVLGKDPNWEEVFNSIDRNDDGKVDFAEFIEGASNRMKLLNEENLKIAFEVLDENKDGTIVAEEFRKQFSNGQYIQEELKEQKINEKFWTDIIEEADSDNDGSINYKEFKKHMMDLIKKGKYFERQSTVESLKKE